MIAHPTSLADWLVVLPVVIGLMGGALLLMLRAWPRWQGWLCAAIVAVILACDLLLLSRVAAAGPLSMTMGRWLPPFGISFTADLLSAGFAVVAAFVTLLVVLYLETELPESVRRDGIHPLILLLLAGVSGAVLTGDLFNLYVWFEVMLIAAFGLLILPGRPLSYDATIKYGLLNFLGTTLFLIGLGLLYGLLGTLNMADVIGRAVTADAAPLTAIAALFAVAFGVKSAAFPLQSWLPASYHTAPAGIAALLAALLTKVGVYALLRVFIALLPESQVILAPVFSVVAAATMIFGPLGAIAETNLRRALGFILIGGIGVLLLSLTGPDVATVSASVFYIAHAALTLAGLYMVAGLVERQSGTADSREMGGLYATGSLVSLLFFVLVLSVSGVPPFLGFWPKLQFLRGLLAQGGLGSAAPDPVPLVLALALLLNAFLTLIAGARLWARIFWRPATTPPCALTARESTAGLGASALLTLIVLGFGLWPELPLRLSIAAATSLLDPAPYVAAVGLSP